MEMEGSNRAKKIQGSTSFRKDYKKLGQSPSSMSKAHLYNNLEHLGIRGKK